MPNMKKNLRHNTNEEIFYHQNNYRTILNSALEGFGDQGLT